MLIVIAVALIILLFLFVGAFVLHKHNEKAYLLWKKYLSYDIVDDIMISQISNGSDDAFDYVYYTENLPLGRVSAFLNYFGKNIYNEEPYAYFCKRSSRDNEFREYGCVITRSGIYISRENPGNKNLKDKDNTVLKADEKTICFSGLTNIFCIGSLIITVNFRAEKFFDRYQIYSIRESVLKNRIRKVCKAVIENGLNFSMQKNMLAEVIENDYEYTNDFQAQTDDTYLEIDDSVFDESEKKLGAGAKNAGVEAVGIQAVKNKIATFFGEVKNLMNGARGHGYAAEYANNTMDRVLCRDVESVAQQYDDRGRQVKHGADRLVNNVEIQTKYYKTASETIGAAFEKKQAIYIRSDGSGKMMQIEVPRDQ